MEEVKFESELVTLVEATVTAGSEEREGGERGRRGEREGGEK